MKNTTTLNKIPRGAPKGSRNAAKPDKMKRVAFSCRVKRETKSRFIRAGRSVNGVGRLLDILADRETI